MTTAQADAYEYEKRAVPSVPFIHNSTVADYGFRPIVRVKVRDVDSAPSGEAPPDGGTHESDLSYART